MKRQIIHMSPIKISDMNFDDLFSEMSRDWEYKARKLQARRWRLLSRETLRHPIKSHNR